MIRLLQFLVHGCWHVWETKQNMRLYQRNEAGEAYGSPFAYEKYCQCTKCGRWKAFRL